MDYAKSVYLWGSTLKPKTLYDR